MASDDELRREQAALDNAHAQLGAMRERAAALLADLRGAGKPDLDLEFALVRRVSLLAETARPLCFGRIDGEDGSSWYLARRHVEDESGDPVAVEWRVPVAMPFYRARPSEPLGLRRRRQLMVDGRRLISYADDHFGDGAALDTESRLRGGDALLAELERSRTGEMLDIVATIQAEQDEVIRAPLSGVLAVQGGPGTGKTAIGLHRAAYLLYNHPELVASGMLVVGPSRTFLRYIARVLPALGEEAVVHVAVGDLVPGLEANLVDKPDVARLKGDWRMAGVLARALAARRQPAGGDLVVNLGLSQLRVPEGDIDALAGELGERGAPYSAGRAALRANLLSMVHRASVRSGPGAAIDRSRVLREVGADPGFKALLDRVWPSISAKALVADLLASPTRLESAASGLLAGPELLLLQDAARGGRRARWSAGDLALVDEAQALLHGPARTYGHVVVDEAQDLTPMQVRMIARRGPAGSVTVLGDLAQATGPWMYRSWDDIVAHLNVPDGWKTTELTLGYRVPGPVLDFASRLLPVAAPGVRRTNSVRAGRSAPKVARVGPGEVAPAAAAEVARLAGVGYQVGCITADAEARAAVGAALEQLDLPYGLAERDGLSRAVTLLLAPSAKGLEFDAAVVVEPAAIAGGGTAGLRLLYVALTRPIQHLSVVHSSPLPAPLGAA